MKKILIFILMSLSMASISSKGKTIVIKQTIHKGDSVGESKQITLKEYQIRNKNTIAKLMHNKLHDISKKGIQNIYVLNIGIRYDSVYCFAQDWDLWLLVDYQSITDILGCYKIKDKLFLLKVQNNNKSLYYFNKIFYRTNDSITFIREVRLLPDKYLRVNENRITAYIGFLFENSIKTHEYYLNGKRIYPPINSLPVQE